MAGLLKWLRAHKFEAHLIAFFMMAIPPIPMYFVALQGTVSLMWALLSLVILGNLLVFLVK